MSEHTIPQKAAVLAYLKQGYSITPMQALDMLHVNCLAERIRDLRQDGWGITTEMVTTPNTGKRHALYTLTDPAQKEPTGVQIPGRKQTGTFAGQLAALEHEIEHMRAGKDWKAGAKWVIERLRHDK
jgi:hypothetical protein